MKQQLKHVTNTEKEIHGPACEVYHIDVHLCLILYVDDLRKVSKRNLLLFS